MAKNVKVNLDATPLIMAGGVVAIIIVVVIVIAIVRWARNVKGNKYFTENKKDIIKSDLTYNTADYTNFANKLYTAMKGLGTDEDAIFSVMMAMQTDSDVRQLINSFGSRKGENLAQWLMGDLSTNDLNKVNAILANNGISYQF